MIRPGSTGGCLRNKFNEARKIRRSASWRIEITDPAFIGPHGTAEEEIARHRHESHDTEQLLIHGRFLEERFRKADLLA